MRRFLTIPLLLMFFLPLLAPLVALGQGPMAGVALCCRQGGQHHCVSTLVTDGTAQWRAPMRCPLCPRAQAPRHNERVGLLPGALIFGEADAHPGVRRRAEARARVTLDQARHERGPPAEVLS